MIFYKSASNYCVFQMKTNTITALILLLLPQVAAKAQKTKINIIIFAS